MAKPSPAPDTLTRKLGPLPVWAWALLLAAAYLGYRHWHTGTAAAFADTPAVAAEFGSAAQTPSGGGGSSADNLNDPLLNLLPGQQTGTPDPLTGQVQQTNSSSNEAPTMSPNAGPQDVPMNQPYVPNPSIPANAGPQNVPMNGYPYYVPPPPPVLPRRPGLQIE